MPQVKGQKSKVKAGRTSRTRLTRGTSHEMPAGQALLISAEQKLQAYRFINVEKLMQEVDEVRIMQSTEGAADMVFELLDMLVRYK